MPASDDFTDDTRKLYIGGIDAQWSSDKIKQILTQHGPVKRVDIVKNFAFAFVENQSVADTIIKAVNGQVIDGCKMVIQISKNKQNLKNVDDNVCFECGNPGHWAKECEKRIKRQQREGRGGPPPRQGERPYPQGREREPYGRSAHPSSPYDRYPYARETYARDPYARDPYARDPYARDPYARDPYASRETYARDPYARSYDYQRYESAARSASYRERSPTTAYSSYRPPAATSRSYATADPYASARERLAYGSDTYEGPRQSAADIDPAALESARRALDTVRRADPYALRYPEGYSSR